jgi:glycerol-3-phosphate O-acyltransferase
LQLVPLTINYERVIEGETFPMELLGEEKVKESLSRVVRASKILSLNFGKIYVEFSDTISLREYT